MRRRKHIRKFIAIIWLLGVIVAAYIIFVKEDDNILNNAEKRINETTKDHTHFISFCDQYRPDWKKMINDSLTTIDYFEQHLDDLVTDVAVGARIMEAQINILLETKLNLSPEIRQDLHALQRKSKLVGDAIVARFKAYADTYGTEVARLTKNLQWVESASTWETPDFKQWETLLERDAKIDVAQSVAMDTDFGKYSDGCIFGTFEQCDIPDYCMEFLWRKPHSGYLLTHQILFHYMILRNDCFSGGTRIFYESQKLVDPKIFLETMCRRVLTEAALIETLNYPHTHQDLFAEQILVCSLAGYNDFLTRNWANVILGWSGENGVLGCFISDTKGLSKQGVKKRVKRWDNLLKIGNVICSVHMGAIILAVIGQQLRYFLEMCYDS